MIAVGGDKLSRGLTLEGLSVSYYLRASRMYDTLMQMGRWFGYRPGYLDLCRLYTTAELEDWYRDITVANEELLEEFDAMAAAGGRRATTGYAFESTRRPADNRPGEDAERQGAELDYSGTGSPDDRVLPNEEDHEANLTLVDKFPRRRRGGDGRRTSGDRGAICGAGCARSATSPMLLVGSERTRRATVAWRSRYASGSSTSTA